MVATTWHLHIAWSATFPIALLGIITQALMTKLLILRYAVFHTAQWKISPSSEALKPPWETRNLFSLMLATLSI